MNVSRAVLEQLPPDPDPPPILYHYTDVKGLEGILKDHRLWAHDVEFMNDAAEIHYGRRIVHEVLAEKIPGVTNAFVKELLAEYAKQVDRFGTIHVFATCFCGDGDLLSQWQSYGGGRGYAVGFDSSALVWRFHLPTEEVITERKWVLAPVRYARDEQRHSVIEVIDAHCLAWENAIAAGGVMQVQAARANLLLNVESQIAARILKAKNPKFSQELEWRAILQIERGSARTAAIKTRVGDFGFIPYVPLDLSRPTEPGRLPMTKVIFGPTPHPDQTRKGLRQALDNAGYPNVEVGPSEVPLRPRPVRG